MTVQLFRCSMCNAIVLREQMFPQPYCKEHPQDMQPPLMMPWAVLEVT